MPANALPDATHLYHPDRRNSRYRLSLLFALVASVLVTIGFFAAGYRAGIPGGIVVVVVGLIRNARSDAQITLALSPDGIEYRTRQRTITADWQDVERLRQLSNAVQRWQVGEGLWLSGYRVTDGSPTAWRFADAFVPLAWFDQEWREGALGDDIRRYAPWLMEEH